MINDKSSQKAIDSLVLIKTAAVFFKEINELILKLNATAKNMYIFT